METNSSESTTVTPLTTTFEPVSTTFEPVSTTVDPLLIECHNQIEVNNREIFELKEGKRAAEKNVLDLKNELKRVLSEQEKEREEFRTKEKEFNDQRHTFESNEQKMKQELKRNHEREELARRDWQTEKNKCIEQIARKESEFKSISGNKQCIKYIRLNYIIIL